MNAGAGKESYRTTSQDVGRGWTHALQTQGRNWTIFQNKWSCMYRKAPKYSDTWKIYCNYPKIWLIWIFHRIMCLNDADGMANSVDRDQTAPLDCSSVPLGAVWSGSALLAQTYLSKNLGSLRKAVLQNKCTLKFDFSTFIVWWSWWAELKSHSSSDRIFATTTGFITW